MNGCYFSLKDELVVGIDDDGLEVGVGWHQAKIALVASGKVDLLHRQSAVDEGHHDVTVREGRALILAPTSYDPDKRYLSREDCIALNKIAEDLCLR